MDGELRIPIQQDADIVSARQAGKNLASQLDFTPSDLTVIAAAISEVARNIVEYATHGEINVSLIERNGRRGVAIIAKDVGPGIPDINMAMQDGFSTAGSLGLGLPGVKRLMDEFEISTVMGKGTTVLMKKWAR